MANTYIDDVAQKRLIHDISEMYKRPLTEHGIYYQHDDSNMLKGYAMIIGPEDTLYRHGFYFFKFIFPFNYPHRPPKVKFMTSDGVTRFHPNLYTEGHICLSILNTWEGESWTSCQSIRSILLTLVSILDNKPLLHEPQMTENHIDFDSYNRIVEFKNISFSFLEFVNNYNISPQFLGFTPFIKQYAIKNKDKIIEYVGQMAIKYTDTYRLSMRCFNQNVLIDWNNLYGRILEVYAQL